MPEELVGLCGWAAPDPPGYDWSVSRRERLAMHIGPRRGALIARLLVKDGITRLREQSRAEFEAPVLKAAAPPTDPPSAMGP